VLFNGIFIFDRCYTSHKNLWNRPRSGKIRNEGKEIIMKVTSFGPHDELVKYIIDMCM
jgi:hypothetical protein